MMKKHNESCRECKKRVFELLGAAFENVEEQYNLKLPATLDGYKGKAFYSDLKAIYESLQKYRGFREFVKAKNLPNVDFFVHNPKMIVEFDESQHFTVPRAIALRNYPSNTILGFDRDKWMERCLALKRKDNNPPYRDEQRAWYDTLRDFADIPTIRLLPEEAVWCNMKICKAEDVERFKKLVLRRFLYDTKSK